MYFTYTIHTDYGRTYVGSSADYRKRLWEHNSGKCDSTRGERWQILFVLKFETKTQAGLVERWLKNGDTRKKREAITTALGVQPAELVASWTLGAAEQWQQKRVIGMKKGRV